LLNQFGSLEAILAAAQFADQADDLKLYRRLATMDAAAPLPALRNQQPAWGSAAKLVRDWKLDGVARRLEGLAAPAPRGMAQAG
jgi:DNA polymerase-1